VPGGFSRACVGCIRFVCGGIRGLRPCAKSEYLAAIERVLSRARDAGVIRPELTVDDVTAVVVMALTMVRSVGRDNARRYLALLVDGMRPTGHRLPEERPPANVTKRRKCCNSG
jgi:hypothetical protein